jgi:hypothetical protein
MADNSMALVLSFLPNTTYDLPALILPLGSAQRIIIVAAQSPAQVI